MAQDRLNRVEFKNMATNSNAICRKCRRAGSKLYLKGERCLTQKCSITRRSYPPGKRGASGSNRRLNDYSIQLAEKQKTKNIYKILEKEFSNYYAKASKSQNSGLTLITFLEMRLDNILKRAGFAASTRSARQIVTHEHILINNFRVKSPNYQTQIGDKITINQSTYKVDKFFSDSPKWLKRDNKAKTIEVIAIPKRDEMNPDINEDLVIELYSK